MGKDRKVPNSMEKVEAQNKEAIKAVMESFERGAEVLASAVGELFPLCEEAAPVLRLALDNVKSKEVFYVKEQFLAVRNKLDVLSTELEDIDCEIKKRGGEHQEPYMDIREAKPQFQEVKKRMFLEFFSKTGGEKNLYVLYDALMGTNSFGVSILEVVQRYEARNRHVLEDFCIAAFPEQACLDVQHLFQEKEERNLQDTAQEVQEFLTRKYDWVSWSVRVVNHSGSSYRNWRAGDHFQHMPHQSPTGAPRLHPATDGGDRGRRAQAVVEVLEKQLAGFVVHAVSHHKKKKATWSFPEDCHYWERHKNVALCVHSD
ncbi:unnamed protein product [Coregonus sp. 'balchen']|nr:unnamed protein product [Coregonus sp. 'balchen']